MGVASRAELTWVRAAWSLALAGAPGGRCPSRYVRGSAPTAATGVCVRRVVDIRIVYDDLVDRDVSGLGGLQAESGLDHAVLAIGAERDRLAVVDVDQPFLGASLRSASNDPSLKIGQSCRIS